MEYCDEVKWQTAGGNDNGEKEIIMWNERKGNRTEKANGEWEGHEGKGGRMKKDGEAFL